MVEGLAPSFTRYVRLMYKWLDKERKRSGYSMTNFIDKQELNYQIVENATIFPCQVKNGKSYSGICDSKVLNNSLLSRTSFDNKHQQVIFAIENFEDVFKGTYIFAGYLIGEYGHFLLESLARLWYIKKHPEIPIIWIRYVQGQRYFKPWQEEIFSLLNIRNKQIIIEKPSFVEKIIVPEPGCILWNYFAIEQAKALSVSIIEELKPGKKIWLSRSQFKNSSFLIYNEEQLENTLESQGWLIFHPQEHSVIEQIKMLASAEQIAGFQGSAFHTLVFLPQNPKTRIQILARRRIKIAEGYTLLGNMAIYQHIAKLKGLKQTEHSFTHTKIANPNPTIDRRETVMIHSYKEIIDILNNTGEQIENDHTLISSN
jgi:capsular polysaccharide biosynthesis protein